MVVSSWVRAVFGHFQNLNLLALLGDLREARTAQQAWLSGSLLCPVAHGLPNGTQVRHLSAQGQVTELDEGCHFAARLLGAEPEDVLRFVRLWDEGTVSQVWLLRQLELVWEERLADAQALQGFLHEESGVAAREGQESEPSAPPREDTASLISTS